MYFYELGIGTPFIWVLISMYVDKGTAKVPTSSKIGVRVQLSTSEIWNLPYGIPQVGRIAHDGLVQHLAPYGYHPTKNTPALCTHDSPPINFTQAVDNFGAKYAGKEHALQLKEAI